MTDAEEWLRARAGSAPPDLLNSMIRALPADSDGSIAEALAAAATDLYAAVSRGEGRRADALPLLAADALLTHAFQAQAESNPGGIEDFAERWGGAGRLGKLVIQ